MPAQEASGVGATATMAADRRGGARVDVVREFQTAAVRLHVLHHAAEGGVPGAWMAAELARHGHRIPASTLYPLLHRMQAAGLLISDDEVVDGRHRRRYRVTEQGRAVLADCRVALGELAHELLPPDPSEHWR